MSDTKLSTKWRKIGIKKYRYKDCIFYTPVTKVWWWPFWYSYRFKDGGYVCSRKLHSAIEYARQIYEQRKGVNFKSIIEII